MTAVFAALFGITASISVMAVSIVLTTLVLYLMKKYNKTRANLKTNPTQVSEF